MGQILNSLDLVKNGVIYSSLKPILSIFVDIATFDEISTFDCNVFGNQFFVAIILFDHYHSN